MVVSEPPPCSLDVLATWPAQLAPWLQVLQHRVDVDLPPLEMVSDTEKLWIHISADAKEETTDAVWVLLVEAMELLELLARVDRPLAWGLLVGLVTHCDPWLMTHSHEIQVLPRFQLAVDGSALFEDGDTTFVALTKMVEDEMDHSATYDQVKHALLVKWSEAHDGLDLDRNREGSVQVSLKFDLNDFDDPLEAAVQVAFGNIEKLISSYRSSVTIENPGSQSPQAAMPFALKSLTFNGAEKVPVTTAMLSSINHISTMGIPIDRVNLTEVDTTMLDSTVLNEFLETQVASLRRTGIPTLAVALGECDLASTEAICMAITHSRSLDNVRVDAESWYEDGGDVDDTVRWLWLAYALFSREADHTIHSVLLNVDTLLNISVNMIRTLLSHDNPMAFVYESLRAQGPAIGVNSTAVSAVLNPSALIRRGHKTAADHAFVENDLVAVEPNVAYRIIRNCIEDDFVEIVVPHVGVCWVQRSELLEMQPVALRSAHSIRHLTLKYVQEGRVAATAALIELIGGPLERLTIEDINIQRAQSEHFLNTIFTHCPNLKRLDLVGGTIQSLTPLCSHATKLEAISLVDLKIHELSSWGDLLTSLAVPGHPLACSLRELHVRFDAPHNRQLVRLMQAATQTWCSKMLETNKRLRRCVLLNCERDFQSTKHSVMDHDGELLPEKQGPLPIAETLAFLSVVTAESSFSPRTKKAKNKSSSGGARYKLDSDVLRLVLDFAAVPVRRQCVMVHRRERVLPRPREQPVNNAPELVVA